MHGFETRHRVARLFLVVPHRMRVASDLMSQHLRLILGLAEALRAVTALPLPHFAQRGAFKGLARDQTK